VPLSRGDAKELKRSKRRGYEQIFRGHLIPAFGRQSSEPRSAGILPPARGVALFLEFLEARSKSVAARRVRVIVER